MNVATHAPLVLGAIIIGVSVPVILIIALKGHGDKTSLNEILAGGYPIFQLLFGLWELRQRRLGKPTGFGRPLWDLDNDSAPSPGRFLSLSLLQSVLVPLLVALPAGLRLGMPWPLASLATSALLVTAFGFNFRHEVQFRRVSGGVQK